MSRLYVDWKSNSDWRSAIGISRHVRRANESFSRTIARRMALMIIKKLDSEGPTRRAVQARLNSRPTATTRREGKNRIILQVVCTYVGIAVVIVCDAAMAIKRDVEVDPETAIRKNGVTQNGITDRIG